MNSILLGIIVPASVFVFSYIMTELLYRHFSKETRKQEPPSE